MQQNVRQQDFSSVPIDDMSPIERAELLRRYSSFVDHFRVGDGPPPPQRPLRKWVPGERSA
jgi:hypothetical protein